MNRLQLLPALLAFAVVLAPLASAAVPGVAAPVSASASTQDANKDGTPDGATLVAGETASRETCVASPEQERKACYSTTTVTARDNETDGAPDEVDGDVYVPRAQGDPIHGVDIKLGITAAGAGDPIHGIDVKLGVSAARQGDPIHGVDVKMGAR